MVKFFKIKASGFLILANGIMLAIILNQLAQIYFFRLDLTEEKRFTIKQPTKDLLRSLDDVVYVEVFLEGDLNAGFRRLNSSIKDMLEEFRVYSKNKVRYNFINPTIAKGNRAQQEFILELAKKGIQPKSVIDQKDGQRTEQLVFPGAILSYGGSEKGIMLLKGNMTQGAQSVLNQSIEGLEFEFASAIQDLTGTNRKNIAWIEGHGELDNINGASLLQALRQSYNVFKINLTEKPELKKFDLVIIAKPTQRFAEDDIYRIDQYLIHGGKLLMMIDVIGVNMDSVNNGEFFAFPNDLGLENSFFKYGVRINNDLVQDRVSLLVPIKTDNSQMTQIEWPFFPLINHYAEHPATRNLDASVLKYTSSIDTVKALGIKKTPLLFSSGYSRKISAPIKISFNDLRKEINPENFSKGPFAMGYLLEGKFTSVFKNRFLPERVDTTNFSIVDKEGKLIVISDGDVAQNSINLQTGRPQELGFDNYSKRIFANQDLLMNIVAWLEDDSGIINARSREVEIRPLDKEKIKRKDFWQVINLALPLLLLSLIGIAKTYFRMRKYGIVK